MSTPAPLRPAQARRFSSPEVELARGGCARERYGPGGQGEVLEDGAGGGEEEHAGHDASTVLAAGEIHRGALRTSAEAVSGDPARAIALGATRWDQGSMGRRLEDQRRTGR
jgi:hypothetical protein